MLVAHVSFHSLASCFIFRTLDTGAVFNVLVLIGSLIGSVIVAFTFALRTLEEYCRIPTGNEAGDADADGADASTRGKQLDDAAGAAGAQSSSARAASQIARAGDSQYADFDRDGDANSDDDGGASAPVPYRGDVVYSANAAIEMQAVSLPPPHMLQRATSVAVDDVSVSASASTAHSTLAAALEPLASQVLQLATTLARLSYAMERMEGRMDEQSRDIRALQSSIARNGANTDDGGEAIANRE